MLKKYWCILIVLFFVTLSTIFFHLNRTTSTKRISLGTTTSTFIGNDEFVPILPLPYNLPVEYVSVEVLPPTKRYNTTCRPTRPLLFNIKFNNNWQIQNLVTTNGTLQLFSAHLDQRKLKANDEMWTIRILTMVDLMVPPDRLYCQIWLTDGRVMIVSAVKPPWYIWIKAWGGYKNGIYQPYMYSCPLPPLNSSGIIMGVSLVEGACTDATNNLRVIGTDDATNTSMDNNRIGVCIKGLDYPMNDISVRLTEWIEFLWVLGATSIHFYKFQVHKNIDKLLQYYETSMEYNVKVVPVSLVGPSTQNPVLIQRFLKKETIRRRLQEVIPYNDCFYTLAPTHKYVVLLDIDEVIVPTNGTRWPQLLQNLDPNATSLCARNVYFLDAHAHSHNWYPEVPQYMHMLQHVYRAKNYTPPGHYVKCFHRTDRVLTVHNHYAFRCWTDDGTEGGGGCHSRSIDLAQAHLQHYRGDCVKEVRNCEELRKNQIRDDRIWYFKDELITRVQTTLKRIGIVPT